MAKRRQELASKLNRRADDRPGWQDIISSPQSEDPEPAPPPRRRTSNKPKRKTYLLPPDLIEKIDTLARDERVGISELVIYLLRNSLAMIEEGTLEIPTAPDRRRILK